MDFPVRASSRSTDLSLDKESCLPQEYSIIPVVNNVSVVLSPASSPSDARENEPGIRDLREHHNK